MNTELLLAELELARDMNDVHHENEKMIGRSTRELQLRTSIQKQRLALFMTEQALIDLLNTQGGNNE